MCSSLQNYCGFVTKRQSPRCPIANKRKSSASRRHELNTKYTNCGCSAPPRGKCCSNARPALTRSCPRSTDEFEPEIDRAEDRTRRMKNLLDDINECGCFVSERPPFVVRKVVRIVMIWVVVCEIKFYARWHRLIPVLIFPFNFCPFWSDSCIAYYIMALFYFFSIFFRLK